MKTILISGTMQNNTIISDTSQQAGNFAGNVANIQHPTANGQHSAKRHFVSLVKLLSLTLLLSFGITQFNFAVTGPGTAWQYCRRITLSPVTSLADFQVKVTLTTASLGNPYTNIKTDGSDLRFYDINNNLCNYWIETWNNAGTSTIWVKVPVSGTTYLYMYYGNTSATAVTNGTNTFAFFDGFDGSGLGANWASTAANGTIAVSAGNVTISCTSNGGPNTTPAISSAFTPSSASFWIEIKHRETKYNRNRFYATTSSLGMSPLTWDYGYFNNGSGAQNTANIFWNGYQSTSVTRNTDYLSTWQISDGTTYNWYTNNYSTGASIDSRITTYGSNIRYITMSVTEVSGTAVAVDWVRVRKYAATEPGATIGSQVTNISASITAQTNVLCNGQSNGSATVTAGGGSGSYTYLWNSSPAQNTQIAINLPAGTYIATVTDNIGLTVTASVTITQPAAVSASVTGKTDINCFAENNGSITILATGGTGTYSYSVDNNPDVNSLVWVSSTNNPYIYGGLVANVGYRIRVKDNNTGCISK